MEYFLRNHNDLGPRILVDILKGTTKDVSEVMYKNGRPVIVKGSNVPSE